MRRRLAAENGPSRGCGTSILVASIMRVAKAPLTKIVTICQHLGRSRQSKALSSVHCRVTSQNAHLTASTRYLRREEAPQGEQSRDWGAYHALDASVAVPDRARKVVVSTPTPRTPGRAARTPYRAATTATSQKMDFRTKALKACMRSALLTCMHGSERPAAHACMPPVRPRTRGKGLSFLASLS